MSNHCRVLFDQPIDDFNGLNFIEIISEDVHHILNTNLCRGQRIAYCCLKESPLEVSYEIIAEGAMINSYTVIGAKYAKYGNP